MRSFCGVRFCRIPPIQTGLSSEITSTNRARFAARPQLFGLCRRANSQVTNPRVGNSDYESRGHLRTLSRLVRYLAKAVRPAGVACTQVRGLESMNSLVVAR